MYGEVVCRLCCFITLGNRCIMLPGWACGCHFLHFCLILFPSTEQFGFDAVPEIFWQWATGTWRKETVCSTAGIFWWTTVCFMVSCLSYLWGCGFYFVSDSTSILALWMQIWCHGWVEPRALANLFMDNLPEKPHWSHALQGEAVCPPQ